MRDDTRCEDYAALIGFLYDDCEADERARISAHLIVCATCAEELESLSMTREQLSAWTPPEANLGFRVSQITSTNAPTEARPAAWWARPLPAWAQLAAAVVVFGAGSMVGAMSARTSVQVVNPSPSANAASNAALMRIERRLGALEEAAPRPVVVRDETRREGVLRQVEQLIGESEDRQQQKIWSAGMQVLNDSVSNTNEQLKQVKQDMLRRDGMLMAVLPALNPNAD